MSDLHADLQAVILGEIERHERVSGPGLEPVFAALRAVVKRHGDLRHRDDCLELIAIAEALGVQS